MHCDDTAEQIPAVLDLVSCTAQHHKGNGESLWQCFDLEVCTRDVNCVGLEDFESLHCDTYALVSRFYPLNPFI